MKQLIGTALVVIVAFGTAVAHAPRIERLSRLGPNRPTACPITNNLRTLSG